MFIENAYAQSAGDGGMGFILMQLPLFAAVIAIMYFLVIRPQQQRAKAHLKMIEGLRRGDQVITNAGMIGKVVKVDDAEAVLDVGEGVKIRIIKHAIQEVRSKSEPAKDESTKG